MPQKQPPARTALICPGASATRSSRSGSGSATAVALIADEIAIAALMTRPTVMNRLSFMVGPLPNDRPPHGRSRMAAAHSEWDRVSCPAPPLPDRELQPMRSRTSVVLLAAAFIYAEAVPLAARRPPNAAPPLDGLTPALIDAFDAGARVFTKRYAIADGLGPVFNDEACGDCHRAPAVGGASNRTVTRFGRNADG